MVRIVPVPALLAFIVATSWGLPCLGYGEPAAPAQIAPLTAQVVHLRVKRELPVLPAVLPPGHNAHKLPAKYDVTQIGSRSVGRGINFYSLDKEIALGRELSVELEQQCRLMTDPVVTEYVNRLGQNLVRNSDAKVPFTIKVVEDDQINAMALPGGFFYINTGLILAADNEAELAGVMAHEIAHVAARHATHNMTRSNLFNLASIPLVFVGGPAGFALREVAGIGMPMGFLKFSRDAEREADLLGLEYQYAAGYDPAAMVQFFERIHLQEKKRGGFVARAFSTHPMTEERIRRAQREMDEMLPAREQYIVTTSEFDQVKARVARLLDGKGRLDRLDGRPILRRATQPDSPHDDDRPTLKRGGN